MPTAPVNTPTFFHYSEKIGSKDSLKKLLETYNGAVKPGLAVNRRGPRERAPTEKTDSGRG